jgi:hypothetical protein
MLDAAGVSVQGTSRWASAQSTGKVRQPGIEADHDSHGAQKGTHHRAAPVVSIPLLHAVVVSYLVMLPAIVSMHGSRCANFCTAIYPMPKKYVAAQAANCVRIARAAAGLRGCG